MKICSICKLEKSLSDFYKDSSKTDGRQPRCIECAKNKSHSTYMKLYGEKAKVRSAARRDYNRAIINKIKKDNPCRICGETENICLDFHHIDPFEKDQSISTLINYSQDILKKEIRKCIILCANCHRKYHAGLIQLTKEQLCCIELK